MAEEKALAPLSTRLPAKETRFAKSAAKILVDIVKQNKWEVPVGQGKHLMYEAWQTLGKYYGYSVITYEAEPVELGGVMGFKAKAKVVNDQGMEIGGAEAYCMRDEKNWGNKALFQLASMAQTRAGAKALRQVLSFVVALAGYEPTPAEEMTGDEEKTSLPAMSDKQRNFIEKLLKQKGKTKDQLEETCMKRFAKKFDSLNIDEASQIIERLSALKDETEVVNPDDVPL